MVDGGVDVWGVFFVQVVVCLPPVTVVTVFIVTVVLVLIVTVVIVTILKLTVVIVAVVLVTVLLGVVFVGTIFCIPICDDRGALLHSSEDHGLQCWGVPECKMYLDANLVWQSFEEEKNCLVKPH